MDFQRMALAICGAVAAYVLYRRYRNPTIRDIPGPKNPSWIHGISVSYTLQDTVSPILEQVINGIGNTERRVQSKRAFWKNMGI